jgi:uncharacterized membrane protein
VTVLNASFLGIFVATAVTAVGVAGAAMLDRSGMQASLLVGGACLYVVGTFGVTIAFNVPRNEALAKLDPESPAAAGQWADYQQAWTSWNHVRTATAVAATALLLAARSS